MDPRNKCGSTKRKFPPSLSSLQDSPSKRARFPPPSSAATTSSGDQQILGFRELPLTATTPNALLSSAGSLPIFSPGASNLSGQAPFLSGTLVNNQLPESSLVNTVATSPIGPLCPTSASYQVVATNTPPRPKAARKLTSSPSTGKAGLNLKEESPDSKKLKGLVDGLRKMVKKCEDDSVSDSEDNEDLSKVNPEVSPVTGSEGGPSEEPEVSPVTGSEGGPSEEPEVRPVKGGPSEEEKVSVESIGESEILHVKCPCGKDLKILKLGNTGHYKLI